MNDQFSHEQAPFTPTGYFDLKKALLVCGIKWFEDEINNLIHNDTSNDFELLQAKERDQLEGKVAEWLSNQFLYSSPASETWRRLRQALHDGRVEAQTLDGENGEFVKIPSKFWATNEASNIYHTGKIVSYSVNVPYQGHILFNKQDVDDFLAGRAKFSADGPPPQGLVILAPSDPESLSTYLPIGYMGIRDVIKAFIDAQKAIRREPKEYDQKLELRAEVVRIANAQLIDLLSSGKLLSYHRALSAGTIRGLRPADWMEGGYLRSTADWKAANQFGRWPSTAVIDEDGERIVGHIIVRAEDFLKCLRNSQTATDEKDTPEKQENSIVEIKPGGRPPVHDAELFMLEAFRIALVLGPPDSQAAFIEQTAEAYLKTRKLAHGSNKRPGETWMKERMRPIWRIIEEFRKGR